MDDTVASIGAYLRTTKLPTGCAAGVIAGKWPHATADQIEAAAQAAIDHLQADVDRLLAEVTRRPA